MSILKDLGVLPMHNDKQSSVTIQAEQDDQWLDEVLSQTFPASDPVALL